MHAPPLVSRLHIYNQHPNAPAAAAPEALRREVTKPCGMDARADFVLEAAGSGGARQTVVEVKTVVDATLDAGFEASGGDGAPAAIFPWGLGKQKGPGGEKVVSARAIKHVDELAKVARKELADPDKASEAAVLFVVVRADVDVFRPNAKACPSFAKHIAKARADGVKVRARRVRWVAEGGGTGSVAAYDDGDLEVVL